MEQITGNFEGVGGCQLHYKFWKPDVQPKGTLAIVHGVGEHIERYKNLIDALLPSGYAVTGYDQRGHGHSDGQRGHINSWNEYREDLHIFINLVRELVPHQPIFLIGHSMGSLVVLDYITSKSQELSGAIISGTALDPADAAPPVLVFIAKVLSGVYPTFPLKVPLPGNSLSRDPEVARVYEKDPFVHHTRSARWATESLKVIDRIESLPEKIAIPVLFIHGEADPLVTVEGARRFFDRVEYADKTFHIYPDGLHEPMNDLDHKQVISDITMWLDAHI